MHSILWCISACICMYYSRDTFRYAQDTSLGKFGYIQIHADTCGYIRVCIRYAQCISDMHSVVSCVYQCEYLYVLFADTEQIEQCILVQYLPKNTYRYAHAGSLMVFHAIVYYTISCFTPSCITRYRDSRHRVIHDIVVIFTELQYRSLYRYILIS